ncbi:hypothetical protein ACHHYP_14648 [Achlya hypogyna]|uniref:Uncharacterized protein n=1 Tax=Achlya hypogyna TaxID=1202772 RepID=A0A1V9YCN2_ACHHY|nr:hypothetical protein ACHHYP_14648 [Achlya hypogyna]
MEKKGTMLTDDWESDLAAIIEKTNQNLNLLRKIGEKREEAPGKKSVGIGRTKSASTLSTSSDRGARASIATDASIHKWKQVLDESTTLKRHIAHKMMESTKAKERSPPLRRAASAAWEAQLNTNQDDAPRETKAAAPFQPLMSLDEVKKSLQVDISSRSGILEKQIADLRTDYQSVTSEAQATALKLQELADKLEAKVDRFAHIEHTLQEQSAIVSRLDLQANHVLKWKLSVDHELQVATAKAAAIDGVEKKMQQLERQVSELSARLGKQSDLEHALDGCLLRIAQLETKSAKAFDAATMQHSIETHVAKAMQACEDRWSRRLDAVTEMQETKNTSFLKTIQGQRDNYEKAIQYALEASVGDLRNEVDGHQKRSEARTQEVATSVDMRLTSLSKRVAAVEAKAAGSDDDKTLSEREELWRKAVLRQVAESYATRAHVTTLVVDELEARGTTAACKRLDVSVAKIHREFDQKWHETCKWLDDLKLQVEKAHAGLSTVQSTVHKAHQAETSALRAKLLQCVTELDQLQSTRHDMDTHFAKLEKDREQQVTRLSRQVAEAEAKRDAEVATLSAALQTKLVQIASTAGHVECMKALWTQEQAALKQCKAELSHVRQEALGYKLRLQTTEKDHRRAELDHTHTHDRLKEQFGRLHKQWQAADRDRAAAQASLHALLQDSGRKQAKVAALQSLVHRLQATTKDVHAHAACSNADELHAAVEQMAAQSHEIATLRASQTALEVSKARLEDDLRASQAALDADVAALDAQHTATLAARDAALQELEAALAATTARYDDVATTLRNFATSVGVDATDDAHGCLQLLQAFWAQQAGEWQVTLTQRQEASAAAVERLRSQLAAATDAHAADKAALDAGIAAHAAELECLLQEKVRLEVDLATAQGDLARTTLAQNAAHDATVADLEAALEEQRTAAERLRDELADATATADAAEALEEELYSCRAELEAAVEDKATTVAALEAKVAELEATLADRQDTEKTQDLLTRVTSLEAALATAEAVVTSLSAEKARMVAENEDETMTLRAQVVAAEAEKAVVSASLQAWAAKEATVLDQLRAAQSQHDAIREATEEKVQALEEALAAQRSATASMEHSITQLLAGFEPPAGEAPIVGQLWAHVTHLATALRLANEEAAAVAATLNVSHEEVPTTVAQLRKYSTDAAADLEATDRQLQLVRLELDARSAELADATAALAVLEQEAAADKARALAALEETKSQWADDLARCQSSLAVHERELAAKALEAEGLQGQLAEAEAAVERCEREMSWLLHESAVDVEALRGEVDRLEEATEARMAAILAAQHEQDERFGRLGQEQERLDALHAQLQTLRQQVTAVPMQLYQLQHLQTALASEGAATAKSRDTHEQERLRLRLLESEWAANAEVAFVQLAAIFQGDASQHTYIMKSVQHLPVLAARLQKIAANLADMAPSTSLATAEIDDNASATNANPMGQWV